MKHNFLLMSNAEYHVDTSRVSKSGLDKLARSPAHYFARYLDPGREPEEQTPALIVGSAVHAAILEPHIWEAEYGVLPKMERRSNAGKDAYNAFMAANTGRVWLDAAEHDNVARIRDAVYTHPAAAQLLAQPGLAEATGHFTHPEGGIPCKFRMDKWLSSGRVVIDVKTTQDASPEAFGKSVANYRYHVQNAFYADGLVYSGLPAPEYFVFIAVEKTYPYAVATYVLTREAVEIGRDLYHADLRRLAECRTTGTWPGYGSTIQTLELPAWAMRTL